MNTAVRLAAPTDVLDIDDVTARRARALQHTGMRDVVRRFGYFRSGGHLQDPPMNFKASYDSVEKAKVEALIIIERYAGYFERPKALYCLDCRLRPNLGNKEFVFKPIPGGFLYRWPQALRHLLETHNQEIPKWMPQLIEDFYKARLQGLWR